MRPFLRKLLFELDKKGWKSPLPAFFVQVDGIFGM